MISQALIIKILWWIKLTCPCLLLKKEYVNQIDQLASIQKII